MRRRTKVLLHPMMFEEIERKARDNKVSEIYISTGHEGLYEKFGYEFFTIMNDMGGEPSRVYRKYII